MCHSTSFLKGLLACLFTVGTGPLYAGGYLWFTSENSAPNQLHRLNLQTMTFDRHIQIGLPGGGTHWNNLATDGQFLYLGNPTTQYHGKFSLASESLVSSMTLTPSQAGHKEDGAFKSSTGNLWRCTFTSSTLHEYRTDGTLVRTYSGSMSGLVGLEWVGEVLYASNYTTGTFGRIQFTSATTADYLPIPFSAGGAPTGNGCGIAYDASEGVLYAVFGVGTSSRLYRVTINDVTCTATLVGVLTSMGYPSGGSTVADGVCWVGSVTQVSGAVNLQDYEPDEAGRAVVFQVKQGGNVIETHPVTLGAGGSYSFSTGVVGSADVLVKASHWLRLAQPGVTLGGGTVSGLNFSLKNGDCDNDNEVNLVDFGQLSAAFGSTDGEPNWNPEADLDGDGEVNLVDYGILAANFGQAGDE